MVTTLDVLSGGRMMLGIGAGDYEEEAVGLGLPYPSLRERFEILEDTVQVCLRMWDGERGDEQPFEGRHVRLGRALNVPQSLSRPHPPILIAGAGEKRTLPLVARYADACNIPPSPEIPRQLDLLRRLCDEAGRDYDAIEKTAPFGFDVGEDGSKAGEVVNQLRVAVEHGHRDGHRLGGRRGPHRSDRGDGPRGHPRDRRPLRRSGGAPSRLAARARPSPSRATGGRRCPR